MNGIEVESALFSHQFARHTLDMELKRTLAMSRRVEQQQQKMVNWLIPADESTLEVTIGYEQVAVDLTAQVAAKEPDPYIKSAFEFGLLEDFDHLYRYANLLEMNHGIAAEKIVGELTEIMPGRPTIAEHRHPFDEIRRHYDSRTADILTKLHVATVTAAEQQTMNFYMTVGNRYPDMVGRGLYMEIAQIEEQHVSHYESLADPTMSWFERMVMHEYNECYMYYSCMESETDPRIKQIWEQHLEMEIEHLRIASDLMWQYENRDAAQMLPSEFPELTVFTSNKDYIRQVLSSQVSLTGDGTEFVPVDGLPSDARYFRYQQLVNGDGFVPSNEVIEMHIRQKGTDYRVQSEGEHPVSELRSRKEVDKEVARS
jgi:rubrerythrin